MARRCVFCTIAKGRAVASLVFEDRATLAFVDPRQFHPGHTLVIPRRHVADVRTCDAATAAALAKTLVKVARAVDAAFPSDGLSVWHSAGRGAKQEVPHLHFHVHPRAEGDGVLRVYPAKPATPSRATLDRRAARIRAALGARQAMSGG
jgi:histidine triad (HIT) family protein